jgi:hypothetical protein
MLKPRSASFLVSSLLVLICTIGLMGGSGFVYAADRTVIGELWSADN